MKLLFDQNLSPRLAVALADLYPDSSHVFLLGLDRADDAIVWRYAQVNSYIIVTKDADFGELTVARGFPPKVIWLRLGNCTTGEVAQILRVQYAAIEALDTDPDLGVLTLL